MKKTIGRLLFLTTLILAAAKPAAGQQMMFDPAALISACRQGDCSTAAVELASKLRVLTKSSQDMNSQLGIIAALLFDLAKSARGQMLENIAQALDALTKYSSDARQVEALRQVALVIRSGQAGLYDLAAPFAASPS